MARITNNTERLLYYGKGNLRTFLSPGENLVSAETLAYLKGIKAVQAAVKAKALSLGDAVGAVAAVPESTHLSEGKPGELKLNDGPDPEKVLAAAKEHTVDEMYDVLSDMFDPVALKMLADKEPRKGVRDAASARIAELLKAEAADKTDDGDAGE